MIDLSSPLPLWGPDVETHRDIRDGSMVRVKLLVNGAVASRTILHDGRPVTGVGRAGTADEAIEAATVDCDRRMDTLDKGNAWDAFVRGVAAREMASFEMLGKDVSSGFATGIGTTLAWDDATDAADWFRAWVAHRRSRNAAKRRRRAARAAGRQAGFV